MDDWVAELQGGATDAAWDRFIARHQRLIFSAIRHYVQDYDDVMDVFAGVCMALREDDMRRLRAYLAQPDHSARFSTWLVTVVRHLTIDWFRQRDGRHRISALGESLTDLQRRIFEQVFVRRRSHLEAYGVIQQSAPSPLSFREFLAALRETYRTVTAGRRGAILRELGIVPPPESKPGPFLPEEVAERQSLVEQLLSSLSPEDRVAVQLYVVDEVPAAKVAQVLGLPNAKAVYNRVYRALGLLRAQLDQSGLQRGDL